MHCVTNIHEDLYWLGGSDRQLAKFENVFPIPRGVSYNAYLVLDEKTVLMDTVDKAVGERFFENLEFALAGRPLDYVVVNHMEPDHCATLGELLRRWPGAQVVANAKTVPMVSRLSGAYPCGEGGGYPLHRPPHLHLPDGPHGPLAGGDGDL